MNKAVKQFGTSVAGIFFASLTALAAGYTWTGGGDGSTWESPENWGKTAAGAYPKSTSDTATFAANTTASVVISSDLALSALNLNASTTVTLTGAGDGAVCVTPNNISWGNASMNLTLDRILLTRAGDCTLGTSSSITLRNGSDLYLNNFTAEKNNTISLSGQSHFRIADYKMKAGTTVTIDDSTMTARGQCYVGSAAPGGGKMVFKGASPMLQVFGSNFKASENKNTYTTDFDIDLEIPVGGFKVSPIQAVESTAFNSMSACTMKYRFNVLPTSPALLAGTKLDQPILTAAGVAASQVAEPTDANVSLWYSKFDGDEPTKDSERKIMHLTLNPTAEVEQPRPVCDKTVLVDNVTTSVSRREIKLSFEAGACATDGTTTRVTVEGGLSDDPTTFTDGTATDVATPRKYSSLVSWSSPKLTFQECFVRLRIEQLNADGEVVATSYSRIYSATTVDNATYTWQAVDGVWDGDLDDRAHWSCSVSDPDDRYDYPLHASSSAVFPANCKATITVPRSMQLLGIIKLGGDGADVDLVPASGIQDIVLDLGRVDNQARTAESKITFENLKLDFQGNETDPGEYNTVVFRNCDASFVTTVNARRNHVRMILENTTFQINGGLRVGGSDSCFLISNSWCNVNSAIELGATVVGGTIRFEGENPVLVAKGKDMRAGMNNNATTLEFLVPAGGYRELPIQVPSSPSEYCLRSNGKTGVSFAIRVLPESPILKEFVTCVIPLIDWWKKGIDSTVPVTYDAGGVAGANFVFSKTSAAAGEEYGWTTQADAGSYPKAMGVRIVGLPDNRNLVHVTAEPVEIGAPDPGFGDVTDGISPGGKKTFTYSPFDSGDGIVHSATAWTVRTYDPATAEYVQTATGDGGTCEYTHPDPAYPSILTWSLSESYKIKAVARGKGTVSPESSLIDRGGNVTLTATAGDGATFVAWYDDAGSLATTELSITVTADCPKTYAAVFLEPGKLPSMPEVADCSPLISTVMNGVADGGKVRFESGVYRLGSPIKVDRGLVLEGAADGGTVFKATYDRKDNNVSPLTVSDGATLDHLAITGGKCTSGWSAPGVGVTIVSGTLSWCVVTNNAYDAAGGTIGGVYANVDENATVTITHCRICDNIARADINAISGAGIYVVGKGSFRMDNCLIANNRATYTGGGSSSAAVGGGLSINHNDAVIANCTIADNLHDFRGGGVGIVGGVPQFVNCIIAKNTASNDTCVHSPDVSAAGDIVAADGTINAKYLNAGTTNNLVGFGVTPFGGGGIAADPVFALNSYELKVGSPAIGYGVTLEGVTDGVDLNGVNRSPDSVDLGCYAYVPSVEPDVQIVLDRSVAFNDQSIGVEIIHINPPAGKTLTDRASVVSGDEEYPIDITDGTTVVNRPGVWKVKVAVYDGEAKIAESLSGMTVKIGVRKAYVTSNAAAIPVFPYATPETAATCLNDVNALCIDGTEIELDAGTHTVSDRNDFTAAVHLRGAGRDLTWINGNGSVLKSGVFYVNSSGFVMENLSVTNFYRIKGGAVSLLANGGTVRNCRFAKNELHYAGGNCAGMAIHSTGANALIENCIFEELAYDQGDNACYGVAIYLGGGTVRNCLFANIVLDSTRHSDTSIVSVSKEATLESCTFADCRIKYFKAGSGDVCIPSVVFADGTVRNVLCCALEEVHAEGEPVPPWRYLAGAEADSVCNCCFEGETTYGIDGADGTKINFDAKKAPYHLHVSSSCRNKGLSQPWMVGATDLDGNPRIFGKAVDIGCYECQEGPGLVILLK